MNQPSTARDLISERAELFFGEHPTPVQVDIAGKSDRGRVRETNEDHFAAVRRRRARTLLASNLPKEFPRESVEDAYALVVADGLGGSACGELASLLALCVGWDLGAREIKWPYKVGPGEMPEILEKLELYPRLIQKGLEKQIEDNPELAGMATTYTGMYTVGLEAFLTHVGDSRAYLFRDQSLQLLTRDQTLGEELIRSGVVSWNSPYLKRARHILTGCLGDTNNEINPITAHVQMKYGDQLLLCTDGLSNMLDDGAIAQCLTNAREAEDACQRLVDAALVKGGRDNVTVIVARFQEPAQPATGEINCGELKPR